MASTLEVDFSGAKRAAFAVLFGLHTFSATPSSAQVGKAHVYFDAAACKSANLYSSQECETAYRNAKAEFDEKAPRFAKRGECERYFQRCMIGELMRGGREVRFVPSMRGFSIENGPHRMATPVADGGTHESLFRPRSVDQRDDSVSPARAAQAQLAWKQMMAPAPNPTSVGAVPVYQESGKDDAPVGTEQAYPVPKAMLDDLHSREQKFGGPASK